MQGKVSKEGERGGIVVSGEGGVVVSGRDDMVPIGGGFRHIILDSLDGVN